MAGSGSKTIKKFLQRDIPSQDNRSITHDLSSNSWMEISKKEFDINATRLNDDKHFKHAVILHIVDTSGGEDDSDSIHNVAYLCDVLVRTQDRLTDGEDEQLTIKVNMSLDELASNHQYKLFYPINDDISNKAFQIGDLVTVVEAKNYPLHIDDINTRYNNKIVGKIKDYRFDVIDNAGAKVTSSITGKSSGGGIAPSGGNDFGNDHVLLLKILKESKILTADPRGYDGDYFRVNLAPQFDPRIIKNAATNTGTPVGYPPYLHLSKIFNEAPGNPTKLSSEYGFRTYNNRFHAGLDIAEANGKSVDNQTILNPIPFAKVKGYYPSTIKGKGNGNMVMIEAYTDATLNTLYGTFAFKHMKSFEPLLVAAVNAANGASVPWRYGDAIGIADNTGKSTNPHLHLEMYVGNPIRSANIFFASYGTIDTSHPNVKKVNNKKPFNVPLEPDELITVRRVIGGSNEAGIEYGLSAVDKSATVAKGARSDVQGVYARSGPQASTNPAINGMQTVYEFFTNISTSPTLDVSKSTVTKSPPANWPKLYITDFPSDLSLKAKSSTQNGNINIKIREDLRSNLSKIKEILNYFGVPFAMEYYDNNINENLSYLSYIGAEIRLNRFSSLNPNNNPLIHNDYYVSPIKNKKIYNNGNFFNVYAKINNNVEFYNGFAARLMELEYYDISKTYNKTAPKLNIEKDYFLNLTEIFSKHGFYGVDPGYEFFKYSIPEKSNWNIFQSYDKLEIGISLKDILNRINLHKKNQLLESQASLLKWDGKRFI